MYAKTLALASLTALAFASGTHAQSRNCADRDRIVDRLASGYGETRQSVGLGSDNTLVEVFASLETGTWTIVITRAGGPSCLVASGQAYQVMADALPNTDSGA
ncbi:MAG: hypothetical protein KJP02_05540 [Octadecabacter sp.]|nr:hypothetical protein [Octadecabacter sp.]